MKEVDRLKLEAEALRDRLSRLSEASLRINESLDFDTVLQGVLDSARSLTGGRYGVITLLDSAGEVEDFVTSGLTPEEHRGLMALPAGMQFFDYVSRIQEPLRLRDFHSHTRALGLPEFRPPMQVSPLLSFLAAPIRHRGEPVGAVYIGEKEQEFTAEDEETLVMFASQAALVIANARRHREEQRARAGLETLINTAPVGVVVFDARTGNPVSVNREARRIVSGLHAPESSAEEALKTLTYRRADGQEISLDQLPLAQTLKASEPVRAEEIVMQIPGGGSIATLVNATPIRSEDGEVESVVVTLQDMTPLEDLDRLRTEFLGMVGHELRTPLSSIKGSAITLLETGASLDPAEVFQFYRIINEQADYMRDLISDLIDVVRIETGTLSVKPEPTDLPRLIDEARNTFLSSGGRDNLRINLAPDLPMIMADRRRIVQVVTNLLSNASRNSHDTSTIRISAAREDLHIAISVADDGRGVPADRLPHLFRKFSHIDGQERDLGLGLAICRGIVEAHGGRIWAESDGPGLGSRFTFTVPVADVAAASEIEPPVKVSTPAREPKKKGLRRVLAVDDDPRMLKHIRDTLSKAGYEPVVTGDPGEVASLMEANEPHVVLLDLMLPETDGIALMRDTLAKYDVPVIFLSAYGQDEVIAKAFEMGAVDYVVKPFSPTELTARVRAALRKQPEPSAPFVLGDLTIDYAERSVTVAGRPADLTATEYRLLVELAVNAGIVLTHDQLLQRVWGQRGTGDARPMRTAVKNLRRKLGDEGRGSKYIFTVSRVGYRMAKPEGPEE